MLPLHQGRVSLITELRKLESNQRPPGSEPGVTTNSNCSASICFTYDTDSTLGFASLGRRIRTFTACFKGRRPAVSRSPSVLCESRTRLARLEAWSLCRSAKSTVCKRKERESNSQGLSLDRFRSGCRHQSACPSVHQAAEAGIEPATKRLTAALPYQHGTHRIKSVRMVGF